MRFARKRSRSGLIVLSSLDTAYQDGFECHAAAVVRPAKIDAAVDPCSVEDFSLFAVDAVGKIFEEGIFGQLGVTVIGLNAGADLANGKLPGQGNEILVRIGSACGHVN